MEKFRSMSVREGRMQMESYSGTKQAPTSMHDLRSYSTSYASSAQAASATTTNTTDHHHHHQKEMRLKKSKSKAASSTSAKAWSFNDPELQRKKRVASYKAYSVEGKMKGSLRKSFRWIKDTCSHVVYGWW